MQTTDRAAEVLDRMAALLAKPDRWCQGSEARDNAGRQVNAQSRSAVSWCLAGAAMKCSEDPALVFLVLGALGAQVFPAMDFPVERYNDDPDRTHEEILDLLDDVRKALRNGS